MPQSKSNRHRNVISIGVSPTILPPEASDTILQITHRSGKSPEITPQQADLLTRTLIRRSQIHRDEKELSDEKGCLNTLIGAELISIEATGIILDGVGSATYTEGRRSKQVNITKFKQYLASHGVNPDLIHEAEEVATSVTKSDPSVTFRGPK